MINFFRKIPLPLKLALIGVIPTLFLLYLTYAIFKEKSDKLNLADGFIESVYESADVSNLIQALHKERKLSFVYALNKGSLNQLKNQRPDTDKKFDLITQSIHPTVKDIHKYTSFERLAGVRSQIDSGRITPNEVMHFYSNLIFRMNTLNSVPIANNYLLNRFQGDIAAQKLLMDMITYLGMIRINIYNVLITKKYIIETLFGLRGTYDVYKSFEKEFSVKSSPVALEKYNQLRSKGPLYETNEYIDSVFKVFRFDSLYAPEDWWRVSDIALNSLISLQNDTWTNIKTGLTKLRSKEEQQRDETLIYFIIILIVVVTLVLFTISAITKSLKELEVAANQISLGKTELKIKPVSNDAIGSLAACISDIAHTNKQLAEAAEAIGKGDFSVVVNPRSNVDRLGNAIAKMKHELQRYSERMEALVKDRTEELERSNTDLQQFAHVASHDLKEPLRKIRMYTSRLNKVIGGELNESDKNYLVKVEESAARMNNMIEGILQYSSSSSDAIVNELVDLNVILANVKVDLELLIQQKNATIETQPLPSIEGSPVLLNQLFFNLLSNALKFTRDDIIPRITITSCEKKGDECGIVTDNVCYEISISDNGIGFAPEYADHIFNSFTRLHAKSKYEGTGLGLALCKKIIRYHNGKIWAESLKEGSRFVFVLPEKAEGRSESRIVSRES